MSTSRPQLPKGNKLFLPKIEYARFTRETHLSGKKSSSKSSVTAEKDTEGVKDEQVIPLLDENYGMSSSFTKFSVLPPITKTFPQATRRPLNHVRRMSSGLFSSANGSCLASGSDGNQNNDSTRTHGDSSTPVSQEQQNGSSVSACRSPLQIVGNAYGRTGCRTLKSNRPNFKTTPRRSFSSPGLSADEQTCEDCSTLLRRARSLRNEGDKVKERRDSTNVIYNSYKCKKHATEHNYVRRQNSENSGLQKNNHGGPLQDTTNPPGIGATNPRSCGNSFLNINAPKARPVSRCEISFDMNGENLMRPPVQNRSDTNNRAGVSPPTIEIHPPETEKLSETGDSSGTPQIQVLINSLDSAKEELPKSTIEVPYTSVREKRRRSALCRNNSKQVDDFLLVHNLRDLGLL